MGQRERRSRLYQYLATFTALLSILTCGMHYAWSSPSLPQLLDKNNTLGFHITSDEGSWIAITPLIGGVLACILAGFIVDIIGRKISILATVVPFFTSWLLLAYANSTTLLYVARFLAGFADAFVFVVMPLYIGEIADPEIRGLLGASISGMWILGMLLINVIGSYFDIFTTAIASSVVPLLLLTFIWMPESPYYLVMRNRFDEARKSLEKFRGNSNCDEELKRIGQNLHRQTENAGKFLDLFTNRRNRRSLVIVGLLRNSQHMSGISAITFYAQIIFQEEKEFMSPVLSTTIFFAVQCVMSCVCSIIVDKTGRRPLLILTLTGSALALFTEGSFFYIRDNTNVSVDNLRFIPMVALIGYVILFNCGVQPIPLLMVGELFPANVKAFASCLSEIYVCIIASLATKLFQIMKDEVGIYLPFFVFSFCCVCNVVLVAVFVPETKGKTLEQIQESLK